MLANPWTPVATRRGTRGRHRSVRWQPQSEVLATVTIAFSLILSAVVTVPTSGFAPEPEAQLLAAGFDAAVGEPAGTAALVRAATPTPSVPATSIPPTSTTRPSLPDDGIDVQAAEALALAARPIRPQAALQVAEVETVEIAPEAETEQIQTIELSVSALDLVGASGRATASDQALVVRPVPDDPWECHVRASELPLRGESGVYDRNLVAQMTHSLFECVAAVGGFNDIAPTSSGWNAAAIWGFENFSQQVAAEAVVVGYCESVAFAPSAIGGNNPWGYGGVFQMGNVEMRMYGFPGASKFDPVDNVYSAATYFMSGVRRGHGWGGWGPWAVVNTNYNDEVNDRVKVPVLPRFTSTDPEWKGRRGVELPKWAVDPWSYEVPAFAGCPTTGRAWPAAVPLTG
jgi:hypothetical protein